jgi:parvulin-like peptidyl-prolyl isomerase
MTPVKKTFKIIFFIILAILILGGIFTVWFYASSPRQITSAQQTAAVARKYGVSVGQAQLDQQLILLKQRTPNFSQLLVQYGLSENNFKTSVLKPELLYTNLEVWFNSQKTLNPSAYALADSLKQQLTATSATSSLFARLAVAYSQDKTTAATNGDLGFVETGNVWPEFQAALDTAKFGDVQIVPGRDGLYIFQILAKDSNGPNSSQRAEVKEIYLKTNSFEDWYNNEIKNIKIKNIYNLWN